MKSLLLVLLLAVPLGAQQTGTPATDAAEMTIRQQVKQLGGTRPGLSREYVFAVATMNHVQSQLSSLNYSLLAINKKPLPGTVEECFENKAGICGNQIAAFLQIADRLKMRARPVEFYVHGETPEKNHGHICAEVFYREKWRLIDVTWGTLFRIPGGAIDELASVMDIRGDRRSRRWAVTNETDLWYQQWKASGLDPLEYIDLDQVDILHGRAGTIRLAPQPLDTGQKYQPIHQPGYLGRNDAREDFGSIALTLLRVDPGSRQLRIDVTGVAGKGQLVISSQAGQEVAVAIEKLQADQTTTLDLSGIEIGTTLDVRIQPGPDGGVGYVVYKRIMLGSR